MQKRTIIKKIKAIVEKQGNGDEYGKQITVADMEAPSSPVIKQIGETAILAEQFGLHKVTTFTYVGDVETGEDYVTYESLDKEVLEEILVLLEDYDITMDKLMESTKN